MNRRALSTAAALLFLAACGGPEQKTADAGSTDTAASPDEGTTADIGQQLDEGRPDMGPVDAGTSTDASSAGDVGTDAAAADMDGDVGDTGADMGGDTGADMAADTGADMAADMGTDACVPTAEICDGQDNDCDPSTPDGADEAWFGVPCDGPDSDLCEEGSWGCSGGAQTCDDNTGDAVETCNAADDDCDGTKDNGIVRDTNPVCTTDAISLGAINADAGVASPMATSFEERFFRVTLAESEAASVPLTAEVTLEVAAETDFDLHVRCADCAGSEVSSATVGDGVNESVQIRRNDDANTDDSFDIVIEVEHRSSAVCAEWTLTVAGNQTVASETCPR